MMAMIPEWARPYVEYLAGGDPQLFDAAGYALPMIDANGQFTMAPSIGRTGRTEYARLLPGASWGVDPEGNPLDGPRYNEDGAPILTAGDGTPIAEMVPYWNPSGLYGAVAQQFGAGYAEPLQNVRAMYEKSEIPQAGISWDDFLGRQYVNPRTVDVPGLGQFLTADSRNSFDWGLGDRSSFLETVLGQMLPAALTMYGIGTGIGNLANMAGIGSGVSSGAGALGDAVTGIDSLADFNGMAPSNAGGGLAAAVDAAGAIPVVTGGGVTIGGPAALADILPASLGGTAAELGGAAASVGAPSAVAGTLPAALGGLGADFGAGALNTAATALPAAAAAAGGAAGSAGTIASTLNNLLGTNLTDADTALLGKLAGAGIGLIGANQQADTMSALADKYLGLGAPARARLEASYSNPGSYLNGPDMQAFLGQAAKQQANALSSRYGNPALSPNANQELLTSTANLASQGIYNYRNQLAAQGGLGVAPAAQFDAGGAQAGGTGYNIVGSVLGDVTSPQQSIIDQMRQLAKLGGGNFLMAG